MEGKARMQNARCKQQKRSNGLGRYLVIWFGALFGVVALAYVTVWGWYYIQKPTVFPIKSIVVQGSVHTHEEDIADVTRRFIQGGFFSLQLAGAKRQLLKDPWIMSVAFRRVWPGTLVVMLNEQQAIARWKDRGLVNQQGVIFYPDVKTINPKLPALDGPEDQVSLMLQTLQVFDQQLMPLALTIKQLQISKSGIWSVVLSNDVVVTLGRQQFISRFERLTRLYQKLVSHSKRLIAGIDCRYSNGFAVLYK